MYIPSEESYFENLYLNGRKQVTKDFHNNVYQIKKTILS